MKFAAILLLPAGCFIVLAAVVLLTELPTRTAFALAGLGIEVLGIVLFARQFRVSQGDRQGDRPGDRR